MIDMASRPAASGDVWPVMLAHREVRARVTLRNTHQTLVLPKVQACVRLRVRYNLRLNGYSWMGTPYDIVEAKCTLAGAGPGEEVTGELSFLPPERVYSFNTSWCDALVQFQATFTPQFTCKYKWPDMR